MHVLYLLTQDQGGLPHYTAALANHIAPHHSVTVMKPKETSADDMFSDEVQTVSTFQSAEISNANLAQGRLSIGTALKGLLSYNNMSEISEINPDLVHITTNLLPHIRWFLVANNIDSDYPIAVTFHNTDFYIFRRVEGSHTLTRVKNLLNFVSPTPSIDRFFVHRNENKDDLVDRGVSEHAINVIPHGTFSQFKEYNYEEKPLEKNTILTFGNIVPGKAVDVLVDAMNIVNDKIPGAKLIIAGEGKLPDKAEEVIDSHPELFEVHNEYIPNNQVGELFSRAQTVVIPNRRQEGHSGTLTVAYSFGKPVVTTDVGAFPELVEEPNCGLTVAPDNPTALANAIIQMLSDEEMREKMARNASAMSDQLSWENISTRYIDIYSNILSE